jgi:hypothetical protein
MRTLLVGLFTGLLATSAFACSGTHYATTGTTNTDLSCVFNVAVDINYDITDQVNAGNFIQFGDSALVGDVVNQIQGQSNASTIDVTYTDEEGTISFQVPAGTDYISLTISDTAGSASTDLVFQNGSFQNSPGAPAPSACTPPTPPPPPLNTAVPGPGINPNDNESALNDNQRANVPLADEHGDPEGLMKGYIK